MKDFIQLTGVWGDNPRLWFRVSDISGMYFGFDTTIVICGGKEYGVCEPTSKILEKIEEAYRG